MSTKAALSVVLGSFNRRPFLEAAIESVRGNGIEIPYEIIVIDGGSTDGSLEWLCAQKDIIALVQHNRGEWRGKPVERRSWGYFMNLAFKCAQGRHILMISDDCLLTRGSAMNGLRRFDALTANGRKVGAVAFYFRDWPFAQSYGVLTLWGRCYVNHGLFLREAVEAVGWIEEDRYRFYSADTDLALKLWRAGYEVVDCPTAFVEHFAHSNLGLRRENEASVRADRETLRTRWDGVFAPAGSDLVTVELKREWQDPDQTVRRFPKRAVVGIVAGGIGRLRTRAEWLGRFLYYGVTSRLKRLFGRSKA